MLPPLATFRNCLQCSEVIQQVLTLCSVLIQFQGSLPQLGPLHPYRRRRQHRKCRWEWNVSHIRTAQVHREDSLAASQQESKVRRRETREGCGKFEKGCDIDKPLWRRVVREQAPQKAARQAGRWLHPGLTRGHRALGKNFRMPEALPREKSFSSGSWLMGPWTGRSSSLTGVGGSAGLVRSEVAS